MQIEALTMEADGSAWSAVVRVAGVVYVASYVANRLAVRLGPYRHAPRRPRWAQASVERWARKQVEALPGAWLALHQAMYQG